MKELLIPVGNYDSLVVAIKAGADAVYLGGKKFGARAYANNFDNEEMIKAIKLCHLYGVKIYVTVNTLVYESELDEVFSYVKFLHVNGVDAIIVQDIGLISLIKKRLPNLEIHASTQVHNTNQGVLKYLESLGVKRVVLARELSLDEINSLDTTMELEAFIHGALCISYSGECLFSSQLMNRSGNRGECAQVCRLPYKLMEDDEIINTDGEYLLSTKELNTSSSFTDIMKSNIYSLKIEGRMKSSEYVGCVTKLYRELIDSYYKYGKCIINKEILKDLSIIFNREYTKGFLFNSSNNELMNIKSCNHLGITCAEIIDVDKKYLYLKLKEELNQGDGIRFININEGMIVNFMYDKKGKLINHGNIGDIVLLDNKFKVKKGDIVNKTFDINVKKKYTLIDDKKIKISVLFKAHIDEEMELTLRDESNEVKVSYGLVQKSKNYPITEESIIKQLSKLGDTPFFIDNYDFDIDDNIFINIKDLNEIRRKATDELIKLRENNKKEVIINDYTSLYKGNYNESNSISILVRNKEQLECAIECNVARIYVTDEKLYNKYKNNEKVLFRTKRVKNNFEYYGLITELGALTNKGIGDYFLNVTNHESINEFSKYLDIITLSVELTDEEIEKIMNYYDNRCNVEIIVRSYVELMIMKYCPLNLLVNKNDKCLVCLNNHKYYLVDRFNKKYRILSDSSNHLTHILNYRYLDKMEKIDYYRKLGINNYRIELLDEDYKETKALIDELKELLK